MRFIFIKFSKWHISLSFRMTHIPFVWNILVENSSYIVMVNGGYLDIIFAILPKWCNEFVTRQARSLFSGLQGQK